MTKEETWKKLATPPKPPVRFIGWQEAMRRIRATALRIKK